MTDENIYSSTVTMLRGQGHDVKDIKEIRLYGESDENIISLAQRENRILVTLDQDFSNIIAYPPEKHPGIIVLKVHPPSISQTTYLLKRVITRVTEEEIKETLVVIDKNKFRIRRSS